MSEFPELYVAATEETSPLVIATAARVGNAMERWLRDEVVSSGKGNNAVLDNYHLTVQNFAPTAEEATKQIRGKGTSHHSRLINFTVDFEKHPNNEYLFARQLFCIMMNISGAFREQVTLQAEDQDDYMSRRQVESPVGLDLKQAAAERLWWHRFVKPTTYGDDAAGELTTLVESTLRVNEQSKRWMTFLFDRGEFDLHKDISETVAMSLLAQKLWVELAVDYIQFHALQNNSYFGDIASVPVLEPKSITYKPGIIYPFATQH